MIRYISRCIFKRNDRDLPFHEISLNGVIKKKVELITL